MCLFAIWKSSAHTVLTSSVGFGRLRSSNGYCLSDEVIYGTAAIFGIGGMLGRHLVHVNSYSAWSISDVITAFQDCESARPACKQLVVNCLSEGLHMVHCAAIYLATSGLHGPCWFYLVKAAGLQPTELWARRTSATGAAKHFQHYHGRSFPVIMRCGERWSSALSRFVRRLCPAHSFSTWDGWAGRRGAQPLRLQGVVEERIPVGRLH